MRPPIFVGDKELNEAHRRVGMIVGACARLEHAIAYLEWQLTAFSLAAASPTDSLADRQRALRSERKTWDKYAQLKTRLASATKAFDAPMIASRVKQNPQLKQMRRQWEDLRERARTLGEKRNEIGHTLLSWHDGKVVREVGRPWSEQVVVSAKEDEDLTSAMTRQRGQRVTVQQVLAEALADWFTKHGATPPDGLRA
jgi:hypothetical protein